MALVQAIEKYLIMRGYCKSKSDSPTAPEVIDSISDDAESEDDLDDSLVYCHITAMIACIKDCHRLKYNLVLQAGSCYWFHDRV